MMTPYYENRLVRLYHGDCLEVLPQLGEKFDACVTDIPYFNVVALDWDRQWNSVEDYRGWCGRMVSCVDGAMASNSSLVMFTSRQYSRLVAGILDGCMEERRIIVWKRKRGFNRTRGCALASGYEPICYYVKGRPEFNCLKIQVHSDRPEYSTGILKDGVCLSDVWDDIPALPHNSSEKVAHPTQKPLALMERCVEMVTSDGMSVVDPFGGSGTTGVACMRLNRRCVLVERDEKYCELAARRLEESVDLFSVM